MCISTASLFYFQIRIYNKCPAKSKDNNLRIGMDTLCRHWTLEAWIKPDNSLLMILDAQTESIRHYSKRLMCPVTGLSYRDEDYGTGSSG